MALNVNRNVDDPFYRYKMPRLLAKVEGKGNGIKTVIANMPEIAKALSRPPTYPTKYFGCELGAQTQFDLKNDRYIVNGEHDAGKLQDLLDGFIKKYVLCQGCDNPETTLTVNVKKVMITQACKACGYSGTISGKSRLITFVCKNPPASPEEGAAPDSIAKKKGRGSPTEDPKEEVGLKVAEEEIHGQTNGQETEGGGDVEEEDDWDPDPDDFDAPDAPEITVGISSMVFHPDMEKPEEERLDMFYNFFTKALKETGGDLQKLSNKAIVVEADRIDVKEKAPLIMARALFTDNVVKEIPKAKSLLLLFTEGNKRAQKYLLGGVEQLVAGDHKESLMPRVALILKAFYDEDIVSEETLMDWGKKSSKKYVSRSDNQKILENAGPFLKWLEEADEEETSDEDDDDEKGVVFEEAGRGMKTAIKPVQNGLSTSSVVENGGTNGKHQDHDDLDIDDI